MQELRTRHLESANVPFQQTDLGYDKPKIRVSELKTIARNHRHVIKRTICVTRSFGWIQSLASEVKTAKLTFRFSLTFSASSLRSIRSAFFTCNHSVRWTSVLL